MHRLVHRTISLWLMPIILFVLSLFLPDPVRAQSCTAYPPDNPAVDLLIKEAQSRGGAAANVDKKVLKAIYFIEATTAYADPANYSCKKTTPGSSALGLMQILDGTYEDIIPEEERTEVTGNCAPINCKLSRCNPSDAIEIAARVLLYKIGLWDSVKNQATGQITTAAQAYNASCLYYNGTYQPDSLTNNLVDFGDNPHDGQQSYCEFVTVYSGLYSTSSLPWPRGPQPLPAAKKPKPWKFDACAGPSPSPTPLQFDFHPLRPFPDNPAAETNEDFLSPFCAMRPMAVQVNRYDVREKYIDLMAIGKLKMNFENFITPLLSITDPKKPDYSLPFTDKAQRYLADFLEGRAYYEPQAEIDLAELDFAGKSDLINRLGVFRKLAPQSYQDELKRAIIERASTGMTGNPYGFEPASTTIHNYVVGYWDGFQVVDQKQGEEVTLKDFVKNWAPLPKDFYPLYQQSAYSIAYENWKTKDNGKWYRLWPYVPMFTREDSTGYIEVHDSNFPPYDEPKAADSGDPFEKNKTGANIVPVTHPHLARTYEVATSLSYLLSPEAVHEAAPAAMYTEWTDKAWEDSDWWMDPSLTKIKSYQLDYSPFSPYTQDPDGQKLELGPLCEIDPRFIKPITSSGDQAHDSIINTDVDRRDKNVTRPTHEYEDPLNPPQVCDPNDSSVVRRYPCEECVYHPGRCYPQYNTCDPPFYTIDDSGCFYEKGTPADPNYLVTYTPFLDNILTSTLNSPRAIFDIFKPYTEEKPKPYEEYDWPGLGNAGEESPVYEFSGGGVRSYARAGTYKPANSQSYYYRYLGSIQCAKERVMMVLQPFITGETYKPYASACFPELNLPTTASDASSTNPSYDFDQNNFYPEDTNNDGFPDTFPSDDTVPGVGGDLTFPNNTTFSIARRAYEIVQNLQRGTWNYWNVNEEHPYALYWCTWLIIDAFNSVGYSIPEPTRTNGILYTPTLAAWFKNQGKYFTADEVTLDNIHPGMAVFFKVTPSSDNKDRLNHVAIIYSITPGQGFTTVESNAGYKSMFYPVNDDGHFINISVGGKTISVEGFGAP